ncbi:caffeine-induced death protein 2 [Calycina marina]|uniref:Caffeine-induced death protein 2 n=1 Tax=Calycina marina TaxID=1763456 RepID=A0A9P7Z4U2_9HELO|nr:caffeine-induced death protein 2 [Calycina marina]
MSTNHLPPPKLIPQFCFSTVALRVSRSIDDTITPQLNALLPQSKYFAGSSRSPLCTQPRQISPSSCENFKTKVLFPYWQARADVLNYCASVATSPDPDDPELVLRQVESERAKERIVDERSDPYSGCFFSKEARTEMLASTVRQERSVEGIIRMRTWKLVGERCGEDGRDWETALDEWRKASEKR